MTLPAFFLYTLSKLLFKFFHTKGNVGGVLRKNSSPLSNGILDYKLYLDEIATNGASNPKFNQRGTLAFSAMNKKDFIFFEHARTGIFNIFTALLCQPEKDLVENDEIFDTLRLALDVVNSECSKIVGRMQKAVKQNTAQELLIE